MKDDANATSFAQPLIEYNLRVSAALTDPHTIESSIKINQQIKIPILAISEAFPPYNTEDWSGDFVVKQRHSFRTSKIKFQKYTMELDAEEPAPALMMKGYPTSTTEVKIHVTATAPINNTDGGGFATILQKMKFRITPALRAKTFYSTKPFPKMPAESLLTTNGTNRLHDQVLKLEQVDRSFTSWRLVETDAVASNNAVCTTRSNFQPKSYPSKHTQATPTEWHSEASFTVTLPNDVTPTFCSALATRQYSIIILVKATGISVENFVLEVPVQLVSAPSRSSPVRLGDSRDTFFEICEPEHFAGLHDAGMAVDGDLLPKYM